MPRHHMTVNGPVPFTPEEEAEWDAAEAGLPNLQTQIIANEVRDKRNFMLAACDWTQVADASVDKAAWATYRQALRDVPQQSGFPWNVQWPTKPE